jgi:hypothetical protein
MKERELKDSIDKLCRVVERLAGLIVEQNEISRKALLLEQRRQLLQSAPALLSDAATIEQTPLDGTV